MKINFHQLRVSHSLSNKLISNRKSTILTISILAVSGVVIELLAGMWDATSHLFRAPEQFWSIQHVAVYTGVSFVFVSALLSAICLWFDSSNSLFKNGMRILLVGAIFQVGAGYADSISHEIFGVDGLVTPSHLVLETGLLLSSAGGFLLLSRIKIKQRTFVRLSIISVLLSSAWIGFNFILIVGSIQICVIVYEVFSSGCAVF